MKHLNLKLICTVLLLLFAIISNYAQYSGGDVILLTTNRYETTKIEAEWFDPATSYYGNVDDPTTTIIPDPTSKPSISKADGRTYVYNLPTNMVINYKIHVGAGGGKYTVTYHHKRSADPDRANIRYLIDGAYLGGSKSTAQSKLQPETTGVWQDFVDTKVIQLTEGAHTFGFLMNFSNSHIVDYFELIPIAGELPAANANPASITLTVNAANGTVVQTPDRGGNHLSGDLVSLKAVPAEGYKFVSWSTDQIIGSVTDNPIGVELNSDKTITATFEVSTTDNPVGSLEHPYLWVTKSDKQGILDNIAQHQWASSLFSQLKTRVDTKKNTHKTNPSAVLNEVPAIPGVNSDRGSHTNMLTSASESAILYYLTDDVDYAQYAADILSHYIDRLALVDTVKYTNGTEGIMFSDWWLESRVLYPKIAVIYDFLYDYVNASTTTVFDLTSNSRQAFSNDAAQTTVKKLAAIVYKSIHAPNSNHSVLAGNGALFNSLMIDDKATREFFFNRFYNDPLNDRFDAYTWTLNNFTSDGVWPETYGYSKGSHEFVIQSLEVIDRYKPELDIVNKNLKVFDGFTAYENYFYPSGTIIDFGDIGGVSGMLRGYQWMLKTATRKNLTKYIDLSQSALKYKYDESGGYNPKVETDVLNWDDPLKLLWGVNVDNTVRASSPTVESTFRINHAGIIMQRNLNTSDIKKDGMMYYSGGASYVHTHSTGIDLELYGKGYVLGSESGSGTYGTDEHNNYRVRHAAHNTVIVNGSGLRGSNWATIMSNVALVAAEPKSQETPISTEFSFSTQAIDDTYNDCLQQRTNSIIRTSETTGYYFDLFRSKGKTTNEYHDYIYHNIGDIVTLNHADNTDVQLMASSKYAGDAAGSVTGWKFFENVKSSVETNEAVNARFELTSDNKYMNVYVPSGINREYATALAPKTKRVSGGYDSKKTPVITMRKNGEAWDMPFVALYEPLESKTGSVTSSILLINESKVIGAKVVSVVDGARITDVIIVNDSDNGEVTLSDYGPISFTGRFGIVRVKVIDGKTYVSLYIGKGSLLKFKNFELNADADGKGVLNTTLDYEFDLSHVSIGDEITYEKLSVYPNPSKTGLFKLSKYSAYNVFNMSGMLALEGEGDRIDLSSFSKGNYVMKVNNQIYKLVFK